MATVGVVDYGIGNLLSVTRALVACGAEVELATTPQQVESVDRLVVPGVGAFADCVRALQDQGLTDCVRAYAQSGRPFLGICVGMQMLFEAGEEFGEHPGLGVIPGRVIHIAPRRADGQIRKTPHIGWNHLTPPEGVSWQGTILKDVPQGGMAYFVHSYTASPADPSNRLADTDHDGFLVSAAVKHGNVYGTQFHPEKSGPLGLAIVRTFLEI